jgi:hypothetical protein
MVLHGGGKLSTRHASDTFSNCLCLWCFHATSDTCLSKMQVQDDAHSCHTHPETVMRNTRRPDMAAHPPQLNSAVCMCVTPSVLMVAKHYSHKKPKKPTPLKSHQLFVIRWCARIAAHPHPHKHHTQQPHRRHITPHSGNLCHIAGSVGPASPSQDPLSYTILRAAHNMSSQRPASLSAAKHSKLSQLLKQPHGANLLQHAQGNREQSTSTAGSPAAVTTVPVRQHYNGHTPAVHLSNSWHHKPLIWCICPHIWHAGVCVGLLLLHIPPCVLTEPVDPHGLHLVPAALWHKPQLLTAAAAHPACTQAHTHAVQQAAGQAVGWGNNGSSNKVDVIGQGCTWGSDTGLPRVFQNHHCAAKATAAVCMNDADPVGVCGWCGGCVLCIVPACRLPVN